MRHILYNMLFLLALMMVSGCTDTMEPAENSNEATSYAAVSLHRKA